MKIGDTIKVIKDTHTNDNFIGLVGEVVEILKAESMNVKVKFSFKDNMKHPMKDLIDKKILHFDTDELEVNNNGKR